ncbi:MAG: LysO family transporter [Clostridia bacterium]|nr:LysO family transporter [Clostridia bacterium]
MWSIIIVLIVGMVIGANLKPKDSVKKAISKLQFIGVMILLFAMGAGLGLNEDLLKNLKSMGLEAFTFAVLTSALSIFFVYMASKFIVKERS